MSTPTTGIEWTDATWNPVRGCWPVSPGCLNCYAAGVAARFSGKGLAYEGLAKRTKGGPRWTGDIRFIPEALEQPLSWRSPRRIFVNSMSDLFHEAVTDEEVASVFAVAIAAHHLRGHTFQILTKRPERMAGLLQGVVFWDQVNAEAEEYVLAGTDPDDRRSDDARATLDEYGPDKPPPGLWGGVSVENQDVAEERIRWLTKCPFVVRFLSVEPLLSRVDVSKWLDPWTCSLCCHHGAEKDTGPCFCAECRVEAVYDEKIGSARCPKCGKDDGASDVVGGTCPKCGDVEGWGRDYGFKFDSERKLIDWVIVGGESGHRARPCAEEWIESVMEQCRRASVPCFVKQMGAYVVSEHRTAPAGMMGRPDQLKPEHYAPNGDVWAWRAGLTDKKGADPEQFVELRTREFPEVRHG